MRSSQGAAISDLAVHRTLRVGFSPVAAAAYRGAALGRRGAIHALSRRRRAAGCRAGAARPSATVSTSSALMSPCLCMVWNSRRCLARAAGSGTSLGSCQWNRDLDDWTRLARSLHDSHLNDASEAFVKPRWTFVFFLLASVLHAASMHRKTRQRQLLCRRAAIADSHRLPTTNNSCPKLREQR